MESHCLHPVWSAPVRVEAAFTTRLGGVSQGKYLGLNLAQHVGDDPSAVDGNRARLRGDLQLPAEPQWLQQVHGTAVWCAGAEPAAGAMPTASADAAVTSAAGTVLAILVADCLPVLLASRDGRRIGASHAGWRGLAAGVIEHTIKAMDCPPASLLAWLGPCIRQPHFEVGDEVRAAFIQHDARAAVAFAANARGRWQCDLATLARQRLQAAGVGAIADCGLCTFADGERFYSHRRDGQTGRMAALLWMSPQSVNCGRSPRDGFSTMPR